MMIGSGPDRRAFEYVPRQEPEPGAPVPEPGSLLLTALGLTLLATRAARARR